MKSELILDMSDPDIAAALADCEPGETKTFTVTVTATVKDETEFRSDVEELQYSGEHEEEEPAEAEGEAYAEEGAVMPAGATGKKPPKAILLVLGKK